MHSAGKNEEKPYTKKLRLPHRHIHGTRLCWGTSERRLMWIRKMPVEVRSENRARVLRSTCVDVLVAMSLWYALVWFSVFIGLTHHAAASGEVACGVVAIILPASWFSSWRSRRQRASTMVCDRCNALKAADDQPACNCGGQYLPLPEMKWINAQPIGHTLSMKPESHLLSLPVRWKTIRRAA
jgi:hypothetical protein